MNILIVGNVLKDVYLNLDTRTEFETDRNGINWLDLSFDASMHHFFSRTSSYGGAAVTLDVLKSMGLNASISGSDFSLEDGPSHTIASAYRYILVADGGTSYIVPSSKATTEFTTPSTQIDYIFVDRSAELTEKASKLIRTYLEFSTTTKLILYVRSDENPALSSLLDLADLVFLEKGASVPESFPQDKIIHISDAKIKTGSIVEKIDTPRIDTLTHLSAYSIISSTILGGFILGKTVEDSMRLAKLNVENSTLNSVLSLEELENLAENSTDCDNLELIAASMVMKGKGILAADESGGSIKKKFAQLDIEDTFENRHNYRDIFFTTSDLEDFVNGVILFDETARDHADNGETYVDYLISKRIIPGIKVDQGLEPFNGSELENYTKGLDGLEPRLREYYAMGLRFAKWRAAFNLTLNEEGDIVTPSAENVIENARILAEYAKKCQSAGIVPIVEPEVVYDGHYPIEKSAEITGKVLDCLFEHLSKFDVNLKACILKVNMVLAGKKFETQSTPEEVGLATATTLKNHVPSDLAGVVFLSGGQTVEQATENLAAITKNGPFPWPVTFSFARALQDPALFTWKGDNSNKDAAKSAFKDRLTKNCDALK